MNGRSIYRLPFTVAILVSIFGLSAALGAQAAGQLAGSVHDQNGAPLHGVKITLDGGGTWRAETDSTGAFTFRELPPGDYMVSAALTGFQRATRTVRLQPGTTRSLSLTLSVALLEQVAVTATKAGDADIQTTPMAVSAVSRDELAGFAVRTIEQAVTLLPSVTFTQTSTFGQLSIRGIGTNAVNAGGDPSSAIYLDGVYLARPAMAFVDLLDLDRVEVLRGPQGTLYGRNAVGGALNLISRSPTNDAEMSARLTGGNLGERRAEARLSGPVKRNRVMGSLAFVRGARDGYVSDLDHPDHPLGGDDLTAARGQLRFVVGRSVDVLVSSDVSDQRGTLLTFNKVLQVKPGFQVDNPSGLHQVRTSTSASSRVRQDGTSARLTAALNPSTTLVALTAFRRLDNEFLVDADITELKLLEAHNRERQHQWSEEVTITNRRPRLTSIGGVFLSRSTIGRRFTSRSCGRDPSGARSKCRCRSAALFGQTTFDLTSNLSGTLGLRYTRERKTIDNSGGLQVVDPAGRSSRRPDTVLGLGPL